MEYRKKTKTWNRSSNSTSISFKALLTIGDLPDQMQAAMVVGVCAEMDKSDVDNVETNSQIKDSSGVDTSTGRKVVRRSSAK